MHAFIRLVNVKCYLMFYCCCLFLSVVICSVPFFQMKEENTPGSSGGSPASDPSPFVPPVQSQKRDRPSTFSPTEDSFQDTANLVKEDSDV